MALSKKKSSKKAAKPQPKPAESSESRFATPTLHDGTREKVIEPLHGLDAEQAALFASTMSETKLRDIASIYNIKVRGKSGKAFHTLPKVEKALWYKYHQTLIG